MRDPRVKSKLFVQAALRRCGQDAIPVVVVHKGDEDAGAVLVRVMLSPERYMVYAQGRDHEGRLGWIRATGAESVSEKSAEDYINRARAVDSDVWVLEVEKTDGKVPFLDYVLD